MALSHKANRQSISNQMNGALLEKIIIGNDLSGLNSMEKVQYITNICKTLGLNPVTKPIQLMRTQGKEIPYFTKDASEQLRKINKVSINKLETKIISDGIYVVTAYASTPGGRQDSSTGVISIAGLKGENLANAMMKAETKSKRRVTLSICGLGFIDESEVDSIPNAQKIEIPPTITNDVKIEIEIEQEDDAQIDFVNFMYGIENAEDLDSLQKVFTEIKRTDFKKHPDLFKKLIDAKDSRKSVLNSNEPIEDIA